ncbi:MAG: dihydropteroate synthase [Candidatus Lokiarchaeota archaeon]|nr:dihydropteroate synthase [Candidatus Lokiarchaeota archaeon]MBD3200267.1 dihydropteroate synthase [Candidatus Lokiarchaeota archaeon]
MNNINTKLYENIEIGDNYPTSVMGVINLSPESFYKNSVFESFHQVKNIALEMISMGAGFLDIGARSTAPGAPNITVDEELKRLLPILEELFKILPDGNVISIDTQYMKIAEQAYYLSQINNKKIIINDVSCLKTDPKMRDFIIDNDLPIILMASKEKPGDLLTMDQIISEFEFTIESLKENGHDEKKIILDPGIGHWVPQKTYQYDLAIIDELDKLRRLEKPILVAISRKSFIGNLLDIPDPKDRLNGTLAATSIAIYNGAHIVRTHDVNKKLMETIKISKKIRSVNKK